MNYITNIYKKMELFCKEKIFFINYMQAQHQTTDSKK